jgi:hypothetical protein
MAPELQVFGGGRRGIIFRREVVLKEVSIITLN